MMENSEGLELVEKGDFANGKKEDQQGAFSFDERLMPVDQERDDTPSEEAIERCGNVDQRCTQEATVENNYITPLPPRRGMFHCDNTSDDDNGRCARFWQCFLVAYLLPVIIFPIIYWSRSVLVREDDFASSTQDAFEWVLGCAMTTSVFLSVILLIGIGWDNRQEIRNELSAPTPIEQYDCSGLCNDGECCQGCFGICVLVACTIWLGIALINGSLLEDPDENSSPRRDEWWAQELVKRTSPPMGVAILLATFLLVGYFLVLPVYSFLFHWCRRCQGYVPANANNAVRTLSSDDQVELSSSYEQEELLFIATMIIPPIVLAIIYAVRYFMGLEEDGLSAVFGWIGWLFVLFFAVFALIGPSLVVYGCWKHRNDMTWSLAVAILCPDSQLEETMVLVIGGGVMSVFFLGLGIFMLSSLEDGKQQLIQERLLDKIWVILSIESIVLGVFLFIGMVVYPIYAFALCCVRDSCCVSNHSSPGRGSAVAVQQQKNCEEEATVATNDLGSAEN